MKKQEQMYTTNAYGISTDPKKSLDFEENMTSTLARRQNSYGKFFEGYTERKMLVKGHVKIIRVYTGTIYRQELTEKQAKQIRWGYVALFALSAVLFIGALCLPTLSNTSWYVLLSALFAAVFYGGVLLCLHTYVWSKQNMTIYEYCYGSIALQKRPIFAAVAVLFPIIMAAVMLAVNGLPFSLMELLRDVFFAFSGIIMYTLKVMESRVKYQTVEAEENRNEKTWYQN